MQFFLLILVALNVSVQAKSQLLSNGKLNISFAICKNYLIIMRALCSVIQS